MSKKINLALVLLILFTITACSPKMKLVPRSFGQGPSSSEICKEQGISEKNSQYEKCKDFYNAQNSLNRNTLLLGAAITILGGMFFERECDCLFGPDRGEKFKPE